MIFVFRFSFVLAGLNYGNNYSLLKRQNQLKKEKLLASVSIVLLSHQNIAHLGTNIWLGNNIQYYYD